MGHIFQTSDEQYAKLAAYAAQRGQTPEMLFQEWLSMIARDTEKLLSVNTVKPSGKAWQTGHEEEVLSSPLFMSQNASKFHPPVPEGAEYWRSHSLQHEHGLSHPGSQW